MEHDLTPLISSHVSTTTHLRQVAHPKYQQAVRTPKHCQFWLNHVNPNPQDTFSDVPPFGPTGEFVYNSVENIKYAVWFGSKQL